MLADRQPDLDTGRPDRVECGVEEERVAREQRRHHDPAEPVHLGPADVRHREVDVVERDERLARPATGHLRAEVDEPAVVGKAGLAIQVGIREAADVVRGA